MNKKNLSHIILLVFAHLFLCNMVLATNKPLRKLISMQAINTSVSVKPLQVFDPSKQIEGLKGYSRHSAPSFRNKSADKYLLGS
ncbi:MAG: hypothetical protein Q9M92_01450 [Enterobacterales bacterium]|nr:hypothetical protein [Enterobacterales bacterium]